MNANIGMIYPVASPVDTYTPYSSITYGNGFVVDEARGASLTYETEDGEFYGDDALLDVANGVLSYTLEFESTGLKDTVRKDLLGEVKDSSTYIVTGAPSPEVGFGYIRRMRDDSSGTVTETYQAWWFYRLRFAKPNEEARTKERNLEWRTPTLTGRGMGAFLDDEDEYPNFAEHQTFNTLAAAKSYLDGKANISAGTST